jgi:hypothetical protein
VKSREIVEYNKLRTLFRTWPIEGRQNQHRLPVQREIRW